MDCTNLSTLPFKLGEAMGSTFVRTSLAFNVAVNSLVTNVINSSIAWPSAFPSLISRDRSSGFV